MDAVAKTQGAAMTRRPLLHIRDDRRDLALRAGPHQIDIAALGGGLARIGRQASEIEQWRLARNGADARRIEFQLPELAIMIDGFAIEQAAQDGHRLARAGVALTRAQRLARHLRGDDVDLQPPAQHPVDGGDLPGQLRRPAFADAHRHQQGKAAQHGGDPGGKGRGVDPQIVTRGQQDVVEARAFGLKHDVAAMLPARLQAFIGHAEELVIIVAQS
jgi:hypothetical protein